MLCATDEQMMCNDSIGETVTQTFSRADPPVVFVLKDKNVQSIFRVYVYHRIG